MSFRSVAAKGEITPMCDGNCGWCMNTGYNDKNCTSSLYLMDIKSTN